MVRLTFVIGEVVLHWADRQLLLESIDLVQEQDDRSLDEPSRIADRIEESKSLLHSVDCLIFEQELVVLGYGDKEEDCRDILETVDPLLSLRTLPTHVEHAVCKVANDEGCLSDTGSLDSRSENILIVGKVVMLGDAGNRIEVAASSRVSHARLSTISISGYNEISRDHAWMMKCGIPIASAHRPT